MPKNQPGMFKLDNKFKPAGDQPKAILALLKGLKSGMKKQTLLGATGTGKTFTMANVIKEWGKPTLVIAHNKTLAAQLAQEFKEFFPDAAVHYFVSYYDYYQPEAYMPVSDTYIEKDAQINKEIDRLRHASTQALLTRKDVIIVASVSCIYGLGSPEEYEKVNLRINIGDKKDKLGIMKDLIGIHFDRTNADLTPGTFRSVGGRIDVMPVSETFMYQIEIEGGKVKEIRKVDPVSSRIIQDEESIFVFPAKHFITEDSKKKKAIIAIKKELEQQLNKFKKEGKLLESERLKRRTNYDLALIKEIGYCNGIENYSRHLSGKKEGEPPETLISYFPGEFLTIIDESHVTVPQIRGMYAGDASRKSTLVEYGFRLPSAKDNRPLKYEEFEERVGQVVYTSATPSDYEKEESSQIVEQIIRPTGLVDPEVIVKPVSEKGAYKGQVFDFIEEIEKTIKAGYRVLATTLTKKMAEDLSTYLKDKKIKAEYLHSDVKTLDRIKIITRLRQGSGGKLAPSGAEGSRAGFDVLVGVNLLREGLDLPEVALIGIFDADKEGFLRSETALIQTIGRAARNAQGRVVLYADKLTDSLKNAIEETSRRRNIQLEYNKKHKITPKTIIKNIKDITADLESEHDKAVNAELSIDMEVFSKAYADAKKKAAKTVNKPLNLSDQEHQELIYEKIVKIKEKEMKKAVKELDFETAAILRDEIKLLREKTEEQG